MGKGLGDGKGVRQVQANGKGAGCEPAFELVWQRASRERGKKNRNRNKENRVETRLLKRNSLLSENRGIADLVSKSNGMTICRKKFSGN